MEIILTNNVPPLGRTGILMRASALNLEPFGGINDGESSQTEFFKENGWYALSIGPKRVLCSSSRSIIGIRTVLSIDIKFLTNRGVDMDRGKTFSIYIQQYMHCSIISISRSQLFTFMELWEDIFKPLLQIPGLNIRIETLGKLERSQKKIILEDMGIFED